VNRRKNRIAKAESLKNSTSRERSGNETVKPEPRWRWRIWRPAAMLPEYARRPRRLSWWRDFILYYLILALLGHLAELVYMVLGASFGLAGAPKMGSVGLIRVAPPYGIAGVLMLVILYPLLRKRKIGLVGTFFSSMIIGGAVEFVCAAGLVLLLGHNPFWNYSDQPFNLFGFICLRNCVLFGVGGVILLRWILPPLIRLMKKLDAAGALNWIFLIAMILYVPLQIFTSFS
jgi:uncharacterized membrane protein